MSDPFAGIQAKLDRAKEQFHSLGDEALAFLNEGDAYSFVGKFEPERHAWVERVKVNKTPPLRLGVLLGEWVHNMRSALDHLAWLLTIENGNTPNARTQFPIANTEAEFNRQAARRVPGVSDAHRAKIGSAQPYHGRDEYWRHPLAVLAYLSNVDKHRIVHPAFALLGEHDIKPLKLLEGQEPSPLKRVLWAPAGQPMVDGAPVCILEWEPSEEPPLEVKVGAQLHLDIAFGERAVNWQSLPSLAEFVVEVLSMFASEYPIQRADALGENGGWDDHLGPSL